MTTKKTAANEQPATESQVTTPVAEVLDPETAPLPALLGDSVPAVPPGTALEVVIEQHAALMIVDNNMFDSLVAGIRKEIAEFVPNLETDKGRKEVASLAAKVTRTKTAIDRARKMLTERMRIVTGRVNETWKDREERLNALRDEARKPLDDWEAAETVREKQVAEGLTALRMAAVVREGETSEAVQARLDIIQAGTLPQSIYRDEHEHAVELRAATIDSLTSAVARLKVAEAERAQAEIDRAELAELRAEKARREAEDAAKREAEERDRQIAERQERDRKLAEEREQREVAERERIAADAAAKATREADERQRKEEAEKAAKEAAAKAVAERKASNQRHRAKVQEKAVEALEAVGVSRGVAEMVITAIAAGKIPAVTITF